MKRLLYAAIVCLGALFATHGQASAIPCTSVFTESAVLHASQLNNLVSCINQIDNQNIGASGIYASQIIPASVASATFGGAFGYMFGGFPTSVIPLTIYGVSSQTADLFDVRLTNGGTKVYWIDSSGVVHTNAAPAFGGVPTWTGALPIAQGGTGSTSQNWVDLSSTQNIGGQKTFTSGTTYFQPASGNTNVGIYNTSGSGTTVLTIQGANPASVPNIIMSSPSTGCSVSCRSGGANITYKDNTLGTIGRIYVAEVFDASGNSGGYIQLLSTAMGPGGGTQLEAVQAVPNGHVGMPQDITSVAVNSPSTCSALVVCSTYTLTFSYPFVNNVGGTSTPWCAAPSIQDLNLPSTIWVGNVQAVSSTSVTYNYAPTTATSVVHNLSFVITCHESSF